MKTEELLVILFLGIWFTIAAAFTGSAGVMALALIATALVGLGYILLR